MKKFEVGQKWFNGKGEIVTIESIGNDIDKWAISGDKGKLYDKEGKYDITGVESDEDLVKLVSNIEILKLSAVADTALDFKVGQKWRRRDGRIVEITNILQDHNYPIITNADTYTLKGELSKGQTRYNDLVELYAEAEDTPVVENAPVVNDASVVNDTSIEEASLSFKPDLDFKVGQKWRRRDGRIVEITNILQDHNYPIITNTGTYTLKGELVKGQTRYNDLVELYTDASESKPVTYLVPGYENVPIRIGDVWLTNDGRTREVVGLCIGDKYPIKAEARYTTTSREVIKLEFTLAGIFNLNSKESDTNLKTLVTSENDNQYIIDEGDPFNELVSDMCDNSSLTEESFKEEVQPLTINPFVELNDAEVVELVKGQSICTATCSNQEVRPSFATSMSRLLEQMTNEIKRYNINMLETARTIEELSRVNSSVTTLIRKVKSLEEEVNKLKD